MRQTFWSTRAQGATVAEAARASGVAVRTGEKWVAAAGGVPPRPQRGRAEIALSLAEREEISLGLARKESFRSIATRLGRVPSTITREVERNSDYKGRYRAVNADQRAAVRRQRPKPAKLAVEADLREVVQLWLSWHWSPEQISQTLRQVFADRPEMQVSHETIYQSLFVQSRGALKRELTACLRTGRAVRRPQRAADRRRERVPRELLISERPAEALDRAVPGHWEGDLILGAGNRSAIGTLVERSTRYCLLVHLPGGHYGAEAVRDALIATIRTLPEQLRRTLTWDQGVELSRHAEITVATDLDIYFCDPHSPWQRGSNENTNGLLRQYFPKGTDLSVHTPEHLAFVAAQLNDRPRETLGWRSPRRALDELLVAATD
ncbi:MAG: IS30 family transposase [Actinomycetes bacterium]